MDPEAPRSESERVGNTVKVCESCGAGFGCGANAESCWCSAVELTSAAAASIGKSFADCLCPQCLRL